MKYGDFLNSKTALHGHDGLDIGINQINKKAFSFQKDIISWALKKGRAAIFADCGLGKTLMQLEWAYHILQKTKKKILILAPLSVAEQTIQEGKKFGIPVTLVRKQAAIKSTSGIYITNYEMLHHFEPEAFIGIVLDESSILKSFDGVTRNTIITSFGTVPYRLACTATPAPNDHMELGNHSEFLGVMTRSEMLSMFFVHDGGETSKWRIKKHAKDVFWHWVCSWAVTIRKPSDLGYIDGSFTLPDLKIKHHIVNGIKFDKRTFFEMGANTLDERRQARKGSVNQRVEKCISILEHTKRKSIIWCDYNMEQDMLFKLLKNKSVSINGSTPMEKRIAFEKAWRLGDTPTLITKPSIFGWGMNWQHCSNIIFCGLSDSYEKYYQAIRRCWRFGQRRNVDCHIVISDAEKTILNNIQRKEEEAKEMGERMIKNTQIQTKQSLKGTQKTPAIYLTDKKSGKNWDIILGDCIEVIKNIKTNTIDYNIFSPPFASLYTYSDSKRDMGNCRTHNEFHKHFKFLIPELLRVTSPGRLLSFHCMNLPMFKVKDGAIGIIDFRGILIRAFCDAGWIYHSEVVIWKDPVVAMQRTKALGLLHKQLKKDSCMSRQGIPDYLITMRKPGENNKKVMHTNESFPVSIWQRYASPIWMDIRPSNTLQHRSVKEQADERHICPLQLEVIRRAILLWTNPKDLILSPFAGIGSEGYIALETGRKFIGIELKKSYWNQAHKNLKIASLLKKRPTLFNL